jgi:hypothetical protein
MGFRRLAGRRIPISLTVAGRARNRFAIGGGAERGRADTDKTLFALRHGQRLTSGERDQASVRCCGPFGPSGSRTADPGRGTTVYVRTRRRSRVRAPER